VGEMAAEGACLLILTWMGAIKGDVVKTLPVAAVGSDTTMGACSSGHAIDGRTVSSTPTGRWLNRSGRRVGHPPSFDYIRRTLLSAEDRTLLSADDKSRFPLDSSPPGGYIGQRRAVSSVG
jgi:hypothetical protein